MDRLFNVKFTTLSSATFLWILCATKSGYTQNLVPNPSFEQIKKQPCNIITTERISTYLTNWDTPTAASTDVWYYDKDTINHCSQNTALFDSKPHSGSHCIGLISALITPDAVLNKWPSSSYREYAQVKLIDGLTVGKNYYVEFYVMPMNFSEVFSNNIGIYFSREPFNHYVKSDGSGYTSTLAYKPTINYSLILDKQAQWIKISSCFKATKDYQYITIGNFFDDTNTKFSINSNAVRGRVRTSCYYLIDDIVVRESRIQQTPTALGRNIDTTICNTGYITIKPTIADSTKIIWENGSLIPERTITQAGTYWITASQGECSQTDTVVIKSEKNPILPPDTSLCYGETLKLSVTHLLKKYQWNTGSTDSTISIDDSGVYRVQIPSRHCQLSASTKVSYVDCPGTGVIPNAFTPNGDGKNDVFYIKNIELTPWKFEVYNRWGKLVFSSFPYHSEWDGGNLSGGVYFFYLESAILKRHIKGTVLLIREP